MIVVNRLTTRYFQISRSLQESILMMPCHDIYNLNCGTCSHLIVDFKHKLPHANWWKFHFFVVNCCSAWTQFCVPHSRTAVPNREKVMHDLDQEFICRCIIIFRYSRQVSCDAWYTTKTSWRRSHVIMKN